ncbi:hypothetical protein ACGFNV_23845 [Streptomyces sp. NPDC048751]|uniref:hypothetical protein n=1 Tax=Streptomyces sp. NPDC048751 TaxID=3365591 RepID=UPI003711A89B
MTPTETAQQGKDTMRFKRALATCALLVMSTSVAACGSGDDESRNSGSDGDGKSGGSSQPAASGLPEAKDMASIAYYLNKYASCLDLTPGAEYDDSEDADKNPAWGDTEAEDPSWGITERAVCTDKYSDAIALLTVPDMKKLQTAAKKDGHASFLVGKDFAVVPVDDRTIEELKASGLKYLTCDPDAEIPSGFEKQAAEVDGCVLSDYFPSDY